MEDTYLRHATINSKVGTIDEACLVAGKEKHGIRLLNGLAESTGWEVNLTSQSLGLVVSEPVLKKRCARVWLRSVWLDPGRFSTRHG